jgi:hypothetical protein
VVALLAPVEAEAQQRAPGRLGTELVEVDAQRPQHRRRVRAEPVGSGGQRSGQGVALAAPGVGHAVGGLEGTALDERSGDLDAGPPGEVVVAGAGVAQRRGAGVLAQ